jgi:hypothetical protein
MILYRNCLYFTCTSLIATVRRNRYHWFCLRSSVMCATWCAPCQA